VNQLQLTYDLFVTSKYILPNNIRCWQWCTI